MTEKKVIETKYGWYQKNDDKVNIDEIIGIVKTDEPTNSVQLKKEAQLSVCEKRVLELLKENEQLKITIQQLRTDNTKQKKKLNTAMKENEHIKQTIKDMINTERTEIGKMTLRQLWRQIQ